MPTLYIDEFVGLSNRFEALPLAFALQQQYGHTIVLDWHELDAFSVEGTQRGRLWPWLKVGAQRVRNCDDALFAKLAGRRLICRSLDGPAQYLDPIYLDVARRVKPAPFVREAIAAAFTPHLQRPVVAVHIRQGDYHLVSQQHYSIDTEWPAVPLWWYQAAMRQVLKHQPNAVFFIAHNGSSVPLQPLFSEFPSFALQLASSYHYKGPDHASSINPVADLFALACCRVLLATPVSGYSHWAANVLGPPSQAIVPMPGCTPQAPAYGVVNLYGQRMPHWRAAGRTGVHTQALGAGWSGLALHQPPSLAWL